MYYGNQEIDKVFYGGAEIDKIYYGSYLVFERAVPVTPPSYNVGDVIIDTSTVTSTFGDIYIDGDGVFDLIIIGNGAGAISGKTSSGYYGLATGSSGASFVGKVRLKKGNYRWVLGAVGKGRSASSYSAVYNGGAESASFKNQDTGETISVRGGPGCTVDSTTNGFKYYTGNFTEPDIGIETVSIEMSAAPRPGRVTQDVQLTMGGVRSQYGLENSNDIGAGGWGTYEGQKSTHHSDGGRGLIKLTYAGQ